MITLQVALVALFPVLVALAALSDVETYTIPNRLPAMLALAFFAAALASHRSGAEIGWNAAAGVAALIAGMGMFAAGWIGGGDAKLMAVSALWLGWAPLPLFLLVTALSGGALAVVLMKARSEQLRPYLAGAPQWLGRLATPGAAAPYGVAIAVGALVAFPKASLVQALQGAF